MASAVSFSVARPLGGEVGGRDSEGDRTLSVLPDAPLHSNFSVHFTPLTISTPSLWATPPSPPRENLENPDVTGMCVLEESSKTLTKAFSGCRGPPLKLVPKTQNSFSRHFSLEKEHKAAAITISSKGKIWLF
jgi:hypothetical protein